MNKNPGIIIMYIAFFLLIICIIYMIFRLRYFYLHEHFKCPVCYHEFKPSLLKMLLSQNAVEGKIIRCPNCKKVKYVEPQKDFKGKIF